ncbi:MAG TPA: FG-GAP repeat protein [Dokdonella sp.]|nr:FG-GAP repeat protein [Dokdonella sp.]
MTSAGSAQLYHRTGATWSPASCIKPSKPGFADRFGFSVAMDGGLLAVSAYGEDSDATGINGDMDNNLALFSGAAYTFDVVASRRSASRTARLVKATSLHSATQHDRRTF